MTPEDRHILTTIAHLRVAPNTMIADTAGITPRDLQQILDDLTRADMIEECTIITPDGGTTRARRLHERGSEHLGITPQHHWKDASAEYLAARLGLPLNTATPSQLTISGATQNAFLSVLGISVLPNTSITLHLYPRPDEFKDNSDDGLAIIIAAPGTVEHLQRALLLDPRPNTYIVRAAKALSAAMRARITSEDQP